MDHLPCPQPVSLFVGTESLDYIDANNSCFAIQSQTGLDGAVVTRRTCTKSRCILLLALSKCEDP